EGVVDQWWSTLPIRSDDYWPLCGAVPADRERTAPRASAVQQQPVSRVQRQVRCAGHAPERTRLRQARRRVAPCAAVEVKGASTWLEGDRGRVTEQQDLFCVDVGDRHTHRLPWRCSHGGDARQPDETAPLVKDVARLDEEVAWRGALDDPATYQSGDDAFWPRDDHLGVDEASCTVSVESGAVDGHAQLGAAWRDRRGASTAAQSRYQHRDKQQRNRPAAGQQLWPTGRGFLVCGHSVSGH